MKEIKFNEICNCFKLNVDIEGVKKLEKYINDVEQEKDQLENNWKELKKWLSTRINTEKDYKKYPHMADKMQVEDYVIKQVMLFMQEIESDNKEVQK